MKLLLLLLLTGAKLGGGARREKIGKGVKELHSRRGLGLLLLLLKTVPGPGVRVVRVVAEVMMGRLNSRQRGHRGEGSSTVHTVAGWERG
mgnify:CR=1 FL=1